MENVKWQRQKLLGFTLLVMTFAIFMVTQVYGHPDNQTHRLDTSIYHFKLDDGSHIFFEADNVYLGDSNGLWDWINNDTIRFYNLHVTDTDDIPNPLTLSLSEANMTILTLFDNGIFKSDVTSADAVSTLKLSVGSYGWPYRVFFNGGLEAYPFSSKADFDASTRNCWYYDDQSRMLYIKTTGTTVTVDWTPPPPLPRKPVPPPRARISPDRVLPVLLLLSILIVAIICWKALKKR